MNGISINGISTHILDLARGLPAANVTVELERFEAETWTSLGSAATDADGRARFLESTPKIGTYRLTFEVAAYFATLQTEAFYPLVQLIFTIREAHHHHVPLLLSPFGYSTYRGS